jgi:diguanylate cyclase (GGDEF)-like protein
MHTPATEVNQGDILVVDDTLPNLEILITMLTEHGYEVRPARSGALALQFARTAPPDLILLDIIMPDMGGYAVCQALKTDERTRAIPIIFLSALSDTFDKLKAFEVGGVDYLTKPFQHAEVLIRIETHLKIHRQRQQIEAQNAALEFHNRTLQELNTRLQIEIEERQRVEAQLAQANQFLARLAAIDGLTQIANRRQFDEYLAREWKRLSRAQEPLALVLCDIDYFKRYNDAYGHQAGDECLKQIAQALNRAARRPADLAARYGGEEFALILPDTDAEGAMHVARLIQQEVRALQLPHGHSSVSRFVTLSIGVFSLIPDTAHAPEYLITAADQALYQVKEQGRNAVVLAQLTLSTTETPAAES